MLAHATMRFVKLIQIPFSHNCVKVRVALGLKGLDYEIENVSPMDRSVVARASGQRLVPVLVDGTRAIADSTAILVHLDARCSEPPLLPADPAARADCLVLEDWADQAFMALSRRIAYWNVTSRPGVLAEMFFPSAPAWKRALLEPIARRRVRARFRINALRHPRDLAEARRVARLAVDRLAGRRWLVGEAPTIADVALAAMSAPLAADPDLAGDASVAVLLAWGRGLLPPDVAAMYAASG